DSPTCYDLITGSVLCLGKVTNTQNRAIAHVRLRVLLLDAAMGVIGDSPAGVEQAMIPPGQSAPYSTLFTPGVEGYVQAAVELLSASSAAGENLIALSILNENVVHDGSRYRVTATLFNAAGAAVGPARVVLMLLDAEGHVAGYRVMTLATGLEADARQPIEIEAVAQAHTGELTHQLYAEARLAGD
ncbi:MAG: hypothetical protein K8J31_16960, partial [Anaerolineae bacterium]|nr:hypothetical protein [Anaerolineae bacterium]